MVALWCSAEYPAVLIDGSLNMMTDHKSLYAAFDLFPTSKGAATHIGHMAHFLFGHTDGGLLYTLGNRLFADQEQEGNIAIQRFSQVIPNYLQRALAYTQSLQRTVSEMEALEIVHFRDIWGGQALLQNGRAYKALFEVNALPSIELPYRYNHMQPSTLDKIRESERYCLEYCDHIVTPSHVIKGHIIQRGIAPAKVSVVPNGAELEPEYAPFDVPTQPYLIYFGALQSWQGVDTLLKAMVLLQDLPLQLVICSSHRNKFSKAYGKLAEKLGIAQRVIWHHQLPKAELNTLIKGAVLSVAPLRDCSRNVEQGCSPLKIFEAMACGTPVVASDLPVVREIVEDRYHARLVPPDRPQNLSRVIRFLWEHPEQRDLLAENAKGLIASKFNWVTIGKQMTQIYRDMASYEP